MSLPRYMFRLRQSHHSLTIPAMGQYLMRLLRLFVPRNDVRLTLSQILVFSFFFFLPTQLAKHFWPAWSYVQGIRVDYLSPTISVIDILSLLVIAFHIRSIVQFMRTTKRANFIILGLLIGTNIMFSALPLRSMMSWLHILLGCSVMFVIVKNIQKYLFVILAGLAAGSIVQLILVCMQFISQSSLQGLWYWLGEDVYKRQAHDCHNACRVLGFHEFTRFFRRYFYLELQYASMKFSMAIRAKKYTFL